MRAVARAMATWAILAPLALAVAGCGTTIPDLPAPPRGVSPAAEPATSLPAYRVQIGDVLDLRFLLNPELNEQVAVRPDGRISTQVAEEVAVYNKTIPEVNKALKEAYAGVLREPTVSVVVRSFAPSRVYVGGEVRNPGELITVGPNLTLTQAIVRAGGIMASARAGKVLIMRRGAGENPQVYAADFDDVRYGVDPKGDVRLANYDIVYVPKSGVAEAYTAWDQYVKEFLPYSLGISLPLTDDAVLE
jgi:polysaccharide export outer membrane protein